MSTLKGIIDSGITLFNTPRSLLLQIKRDLGIDNPDYHKAIKHQRSIRGIPKKIKLYVEKSPTQIVLPRGYLSNLLNYCEQQDLQLNLDNQTISFPPEFPKEKHLNLYNYQEPWVADMLRFNQGIGCAPPGCHRKGTMILMADGTTKAVEKIVVGDKLMGPTGHRNVLQLCRGFDAMYKISPVKGEPFYVNSEHILTVVISSNLKSKRYAKNQVVDISVKDWLELPKYVKAKTKLFRAKVDKFLNKKCFLPIDPYFLGILLGDGGLTQGIRVTSADKEIKTEVYKQADSWGLTVKELYQEDNNAVTYHMSASSIVVTGRKTKMYNPNGLLYWLKKLGLFRTNSGTKFVPYAYKTSSLKNRLAILAGLIDTDGHLSRKTFDFVSKSKRLAEDVCYLCRSCGLAAYLSTKIVEESTYWRVSISGHTDMIPTLLPRKQALPRLQIKDVSRTGFKIEKVSNKEKYYGFTIDGDHRYLLDDFTVTHNSGKTNMSIEIYARLGQPCLWLTHTSRLASQTAARVKDILGIEAGLIGAGKENIRHFTVGMIPTLVRRDLSKYAKLFGLLIIDECHHVPAKSSLSVISQFKALYRYGVTATPYREDQLEALMYYGVGPQLSYLDRSDLRRLGLLMTPTVVRKPTKFNFPYSSLSKKFGYPALEDSLVEDEPRNNQIVADIINESTIKQDNVCIVLVNRINHGEILYQKLTKILDHVGFVHSEMPAKLASAVLDDFEQGKLKVLIATYTMLAEGFDYKPANRLFLTAPVKGRSRIEQACGRIERVSPGKTDAIVYDYVDVNVGVLERQAELRLEIYEAAENPVYTC